MNVSLAEIERVFLALSDKTRIRLVDLMRNGEVTVNYLCETLGESQPKISRHLAYLRSMEIVSTRRDGKWIYYRLSVPENELGSRILSDTLDWIAFLSEGGTSAAAPRRVEPVTVPAVRSEQPESDTFTYPNTKNEPAELEVYLL